MEKKITITVPDDMVADLDELVREEGCSEGEIVLNAIKRRIAGSKIRTMEELKASIAEDVRSKQTS